MIHVDSLKLYKMEGVYDVNKKERLALKLFPEVNKSDQDDIMKRDI